MFRKLISNLAFSPALIGQLSFYAKRLKKEEATRRLGLIFLALALLVQSFAVFQPAESANASSSTDMVNGGISSISEFLKSYDANTKHLKDVMDYTGITRAEIKSAQPTTFKANNRLSWGFASRFSYSQGERKHNVKNSQGQIIATVYSRPLKLWGSSTMNVSGWVGKSKSLGWFAIMRSCGNLVTEALPPPPPPPSCLLNNKLLASDKNCRPCPGNETLWIDDPSCKPNIVQSKTATNNSQGFVDAKSVTSQASDQISFTITVQNTGLSPTLVKLEDPIEDTLEYSKVIDYGGGTLNETTKVISWPSVNLQPGVKQTRTFVVRILDTIPSTATGTSDATSYDCTISNVFGNSINIKVECPTPKVIEKVVEELPTTGQTENMIFAGVVFSIATYLYARSKQTKKEIHLIRRDAIAGTL